MQKCLLTLSVLDRLGDKYQTGSTTTSRARKEEPTRQEQARITELKQGKREYETRRYVTFTIGEV